MSSHLNHVRHKIFKSSFESFRSKIIDPTNLFSCVPDLDKDDADQVLSIILPISLEEYDFHQLKQRTFLGTPLFYIVDVLSHLKIMCDLMLDEEALLEDTNEISPLWQKINHVINIALPFFKEQSQDYPFLSSDAVIHYMHNQHINTNEIQPLIETSLYGFKSKNPAYLSLIEPILFEPNLNLKEQELKLQRIKAIVLNASFLKPKNCIFNIAPTTALKGLKYDELTLLNIEEQYDDTSEFIGFLHLTINRNQGHENLEKSLTVIINYLKKLEERNPSKKRQSGHDSLNKKAYSKNSIPPWIDLGGNLYLETSSLDDDDTVELIKMTVNGQEADEEDDFSSFDDKDVSIDEITQDIFIQETDANIAPEVRIFNKTAQITHIELHNQFLKDKLTPTELESILKSIEKTIQKGSTSDVKLRTLMLITASLFTGYNLTQVGALRWVKNEKYRHSIVNLNEDCSYIHIPIPRYHHKHTETRQAEHYFDAENGLLRLKVPSRLQNILFSLLTQYYALKPETRPTLIKDSSLKPDQIQKTITSFKLDKRINLTLIQNNFPSHALFFANGDQWAVAALSGREDITSSTQKHYTTVHIEYLQQIYNDTIAKLYNESLELPQKTNIKHHIGDGDIFRPRKYKVINILKALAHAMTTLYNDHLDHNWQTSDLVDLHNLLTIYIETKQSYIIGSRNVVNPFISPEKLDRDGFYIWNDKNINNGYTTRTGYLPKNLVNEIHHFMTESNWILRKLKKKKCFDQSSFKKYFLDEDWGEITTQSTRNKRFVGFVLLKKQLKEGNEKHIKKITTTTYTRKKASRLTKHLVNDNGTFSILKENANRHYFRSTLLERGLNPEYIDELMGHRHIGTEIWNPKSLFNPIDFRKETKKILDQLYKDFSVPSPLLNKGNKP